MSAPFEPRRSTVRTSLWIGYWIFLFIIMHTPVVGTGRMRFDYADKVVHFFLYALLTWMGARRLSNRPGGLRFNGLLVWALIYILYGAVDEYLQQFVGRSMEFTDWLADMMGVIVATTLVALKARRLSEPTRLV